MKWLILLAGLVAGATTAGHFLIGSKQFLKPMLDAEFEKIPKKVMHCVFHYVSVFLVLTTGALLLIGSGVNLVSEMDFGEGHVLLVRFIALNYAAFAVWQIVIAKASGIEGGVFKLFQWMFFVAIAVLAWLGTL